MRKIIVVLFMATVILTGCGLTKEDLGLNRTSPDASVVETRQPLDLPPDFDKLPD